MDGKSNSIKMPSLFKRILVAFVIIIGLTIIVVQILPKSESSIPEDDEMRKIVAMINSDLPLKIGTIGQLDKVRLVDDTLSYYVSIYGDNIIDSFYEEKENYDAVRDIVKYGIIKLNGQKNNGTKFAYTLYSKGIMLRFVVKTPSRREFSWIYSGNELWEYIDKVRISPTEAMHAILDAHIKLANLSLPMELDDFGELQSVYINSVNGSLGEREKLIEIKHSENNIIFVIETNEKNFNMNDIKPVADNEMFLNAMAKEMTEDPDMQAFVSQIVISHSDCTYLYYNSNRTDSVKITIPYNILKKYSVVPLEILM